MIEMLLCKPPTVVAPSGPLDWTSTSPSSGGWTLNGSKVVTGNAFGVNAYAAFGPLLPNTPWYFDINIDQGYQPNVTFLGISNGITGATWDGNWASSNLMSWYWSGTYYGAAGGSAPSTLVAGTYRFAMNTATKQFYMQRLSPTTTSIGVVTLSGFNINNLRPFVSNQGGYPPPANITLLAIGSGNGGLY